MLFDDDGGLQLGDDVGYGPARVLSNREVSSAIAEIETINIAAFSAAYRDGYVARAASMGDGTNASILAEYDNFA